MLRVTARRSLAISLLFVSVSKCSQGETMKSKSLLIAALGLLTPTLAFAGAKNSADVDIYQAVTVAGTQLAAGHYRLTWDGSGPDTTVSFGKDNKTVLNALARVRTNPTGQNEIETDT